MTTGQPQGGHFGPTTTTMTTSTSSSTKEEQEEEQEVKTEVRYKPRERRPSGTIDTRRDSDSTSLEERLQMVADQEGMALSDHEE